MSHDRCRPACVPRCGSLLALVGAAVVLSACEDELSSPVGPGEEAPGGGPASSLTITPPAVEVVPNEIVTFSATARDESEATLEDPEIIWRSLDPAIVDFISAADRATGRVTGLASEGGTARIVAELDGQADTATVTVLPLSARLFIVDSTRLDLVSSPDELARGELVFRVIGGPVDVEDLTAGRARHVAGAQSPTFFARVEDATLAGDRLILQTSDAQLREIFPGGAQASGRISLRMGPGGRVASVCSDARGIHCPPEPGAGGDGTAGAARRVAPRAADDLFDFPDGFDLCASPTRIDGAEVCVGGSAKLDGGLDVGIDLDVRVIVDPPEFSMVAAGDISAFVDYLLELSASAGYVLEREIPLASRTVFILGIPGQLKLLLVPGLSGHVGANLELSGRVDGSASATAGATCDRDLCTEVLDASRELNIDPPTFRLRSGNAEARLFLVTRLKLEWAGNEPLVEVGPFASLAGEASELNHIQHQEGTQWPRLHAGLDFGVQAGLGYEVKVLEESLATISLNVDIIRADILDWWAQGELDVVTLTTGIDLDPDGYGLTLIRRDPDAAPVWSESLQRATPSTGEATFVPRATPCLQVVGSPPSDCDLVGTHHNLEASGVMWNCEVQGGQPRHAHLHPFGRIGAGLEIVCISVLEAMANTVDEFLAAGLIDDADVAESLKEQLAAADAARLSDRPRPAHNILDAFVRLVEAQTNTGSGGAAPTAGPRPTDGKHIHPDAAALLIERTRLVQESYLENITRA